MKKTSPKELSNILLSGLEPMLQQFTEALEVKAKSDRFWRDLGSAGNMRKLYNAVEMELTDNKERFSTDAWRHGVDVRRDMPELWSKVEAEVKQAMAQPGFKSIAEKQRELEKAK